MEQISGFPKNLAYNLKRLQSSIIKQKIVIQPDRSEYNANDRMIFNFPNGRMIDTRSICLTAQCATLTSGCFFSRGGLSSLIENLQITANSRVLQSTQSYNYIWNTLADISGYFSPDQLPKRILYENADPSVKHTNVNGEGVPSTSIKTTITGETESYYFTVNNWLGFFNSSAPMLNLNDIGALQLTITLAPSSCLWVGCSASANSAITPSSSGYKIDKVNLSMDTITLTSSLYYDLLKSQLEGSGLNIAYNDYLVSTSTLNTKDVNGISHTAQFATNSLDSVIATFRPEKYNSPSPLLVGGAVVDFATVANTRGSSTSYSEIIGNPVGNEGNFGGFNNSIYFQRSGGVDTTNWYINSQPLTQNSTAIQIYNNTLQALDFANCDIGVGNLHQGALTSGFYNRNYFVDILSLENISGDGNNWISGLSGNGGLIQVLYNARFVSNTTLNAEKVYIYLIAKVSKVLNVKIGRNLDLME